MAKKYDFNYIIIGSGPAGHAAALALAKSKKRVAVVEKSHFGGANLNTRDIPFSLGLDFAHTYQKLQNLPAINHQNLHYNFPSIATHTEQTISAIRAQNLQNLLDAGVTYLEGSAHFLDNNTISVGSTNYTSDSFILATGSTLKTKEITGLDVVDYYTPNTALLLRHLPECIFIVGGGATGCEIASYYASLGVKVILAERAHRILPREDKEVSEVITQYFENELGITVVANAKVVALEQDSISKRVIFNTAGQEKLVRVDCIILATGSQPVTDYGLENAGVKYKNSGIVVDKFFQTSAHNIYAIGDAILNKSYKDSSTERSEYEGNLVAMNILHKTTRSAANYQGFIRRVGAYPAVATVGMNEYDLLSCDRRYKKAVVHLDALPISQIDRTAYGFVKILTDQSSKILGATIVAPHADLMIEELALAVRHHLAAISIASTPHSVNSYDYTIKLAAKKLAK